MENITKNSLKIYNKRHFLCHDKIFPSSIYIGWDWRHRLTFQQKYIESGRSKRDLDQYLFERISDKVNVLMIPKGSCELLLCFFSYWWKLQVYYLLRKIIKVTATDMRYFTRRKFSRSLVHKRNFGLIWEVVFNLEYLFHQWR